MPEDGYCLVLGNLYAGINHVTGSSGAFFGVSNLSNALPQSQIQGWFLSASNPTGSHSWPGATQAVFPVTAGANTFHLIAYKNAGTSATFVRARLSLVFIPNSYGIVASP